MFKHYLFLTYSKIRIAEIAGQLLTRPILLNTCGKQMNTLVIYCNKLLLHLQLAVWCSPIWGLSTHISIGKWAWVSTWAESTWDVAEKLSHVKGSWTSQSSRHHRILKKSLYFESCWRRGIPVTFRMAIGVAATMKICPSSAWTVTPLRWHRGLLLSCVLYRSIGKMVN